MPTCGRNIFVNQCFVLFLGACKQFPHEPIRIDVVELFKRFQEGEYQVLRWEDDRGNLGRKCFEINRLQTTEWLVR